jgi:hypothetical protein
MASSMLQLRVVEHGSGQQEIEQKNKKVHDSSNFNNDACVPVVFYARLAAFI